MRAPRGTVEFADSGEAADLAAFLGRLIHYDRAAAVRVQAAGTKLAVFGRPPTFDVVAVRTAVLTKPYENGLDHSLDITVSAGELLDSLDEHAAIARAPEAVTGPPWAGLLPPRGGWRPEPGLPSLPAMAAMVARAVAEFRARAARLASDTDARAERDRIGQDLWSRPVGDTRLPLRAVHAAKSLGFLRPPAASAEPGPGPAPGVDLLAAGSWLRLRTPYGSVALRVGGLGPLSVTPK